MLFGTEKLARLVSAFVSERVDVPSKEKIEVWRSEVYSKLFSVAFSSKMALIGQSESSDKFNNELNELIHLTAETSGEWIEAKLKQSLGVQNPNIRINERPALNQCLSVCFAEALTVIEERGYNIEQARSHSCFCFLSEALAELTLRGDLSSTQDAKETLSKIMDSCDGMSEEVVRLLHSTQHETTAGS